MKNVSLLIFLVLFVSCGNEDGSYENQDFIASYAFTQSATGHVESSRDETTLSTSVVDSSGTLVIGEISDAALHNGRVYVLDKKNGTLIRHRLDSERPPQVQGGRGNGPAELAFPKHIAVTDSSLLIGVRGSVIKRYPGSTLSEEGRSVNVGMSFQDFCTMEGKIYALGVHASDTDLIHVFDRNGTRVDAFASEFEGIDDFQRRQYTEGSIHCIPGRSAVVASLSYMGRLYAYSSQGRKLWVSTVDPFVSLKYALIDYNGRPAVQKDYRADGYRDRIDGVHPLNDSLALVQVERQFAEEASLPEIRSYMIHLGSGNGHRLSNSPPRFAAMEGTRAVAVQNTPVPQYSIHTIEIR